MSLPGIRSSFLIIFLGCAAMIGIVLIMQHVLGLPPCPLCITQRIMVIGAGLFALLGFIHNPKGIGRRIYALISTLWAIGAIGFAGRHVWLQHLPEGQVPACGPSLEYLLENFPLRDALSLLLNGDGNCADVQWTLLGLSIPEQGLIAFSLLFIACLYQLLRKA